MHENTAASRPTSTLMNDVRALLHSRGERMTRARRAVLAVLARDPRRHLSAEEIVAAVAERDPTVHRASVYRNLEVLADVGVVQHVHLSHGATAHHLVADGLDHLHLQCASCLTVIDVPPDLLRDVAAQVEDAYAFSLDLGHVALSGRCSSCRRPD